LAADLSKRLLVHNVRQIVHKSLRVEAATFLHFLVVIHVVWQNLGHELIICMSDKPRIHWEMVCHVQVWPLQRSYRILSVDAVATVGNHLVADPGACVGS